MGRASGTGSTKRKRLPSGMTSKLLPLMLGGATGKSGRLGPHRLAAASGREVIAYDRLGFGEYDFICVFTTLITQNNNAQR